MSSSNYDYSRRTFLKLVSTSVLVSLSTTLVSCGADASTEVIAKHLIGLLNYPEDASKIGRLYITQVAELENKSYQQLTDDLLSSLDLENTVNIVENLSLLDLSIREKVKQDFEDENILILKGWMLSKTEASLCAITSSYRHNMFALIT